MDPSTLSLFGAISWPSCLWSWFSVECGYRLGKYRRSRHEQEKEAPLGTMVGATLGLLAFILAFTFGLAAARFDTRRQVLLDEANAIGTTYLRAGILPEGAKKFEHCSENTWALV